MQTDPILALLALFITLTLALAGLLVWIGASRTTLYVRTERGFTPIRIKPGQRIVKWKRPDGTRVAFHLDRDFAIPSGRRSHLYFGNGEDGQLAAWNMKWEPVYPDGNYLIAALEDTRELKWMQAQRDADKTNRTLPIWLIIAAGIIAWYFLAGPGHHPALILGPGFP